MRMLDSCAHMRGWGWAGLVCDAEGYTPLDIQGALRQIPVDPALCATLRSLSLAADLRILSDANSVFIETILDSHGLSAVFTHIATNPVPRSPFSLSLSVLNCKIPMQGAWSASGQLHVQPYLPVPHECPRCKSAPNICKGQVLDAWHQSLLPHTKVYAGDGSNDFCPATRLTSFAHLRCFWHCRPFFLPYV